MYLSMSNAHPFCMYRILCESHAQVHKRSIHVLVAMLEKEMVGWGGLLMLHYFNLSLVFGFLNTQILELEMRMTTEIIFFKIEKFEDIGVNCSACRIRVISMFCECVYFLHSESLWTPPGKFKVQKRWALSEAWVWGDLFTIDVNSILKGKYYVEFIVYKWNHHFRYTIFSLSKYNINSR